MPGVRRSVGGIVSIGSQVAISWTVTNLSYTPVFLVAGFAYAAALLVARLTITRFGEAAVCPPPSLDKQEGATVDLSSPMTRRAETIRSCTSYSACAGRDVARVYQPASPRHQRHGLCRAQSRDRPKHRAEPTPGRRHPRYRCPWCLWSKRFEPSVAIPQGAEEVSGVDAMVAEEWRQIAAGVDTIEHGYGMHSL